MSKLFTPNTQGAPLKGVYIGDMGTTFLEIALELGFDYVRLDNEHTFASPHELREMIRLCDAYGVPTLVRTPSLEDVTRLLDFGATGILYPDIRTAEQAKKLVELCKYAPVGARGISRANRCTRYGLIAGKDYYDYAAQNICVAVQIESVEGMENLDEILSVPGMDLVTAGPEDMAQSMGVWGQTKHPDILAAQDRLVEAAHRHGKLAMLSATTPERYRYLTEKQTDLLTVAFDADIVATALRDRLTGIAGKEESRA